MPFLRVVSRANWIRTSWPPWVPAGDVPSDSLSEIWTTDNELSVYKADSQDEIDSAVAGIAAGRANISPVDYVLISPETLDNFGLKAAASPGATHSRTANALHADVLDISGLNLLILAAAMADDLPKIRVARRQVETLLQRGIATGDIDVTALQPSLVSALKITPTAL